MAPPVRRRPRVDWRRFERCTLCGAVRGAACGGGNVQPHNVRLLVVDRNTAGQMLLGRREHVTWSRPGTTHGAHAHHAMIGGLSVCSGALIADETIMPLYLLGDAERCQREPCRRLWRAEDER
jgi:hypothetical protein